jgi:hypothetical protein
MSPWFDARTAALIVRLDASHRRWTGRGLIAIAPGQSLAEAVWLSPAVIVAHGTEPDPVLCYGNRTALDLWEMPWERFTATPSRFTAEPPSRDERARFLAAVAERGFIDDYSGIRISSTGRRFRIHRATVWNVLDESGAPAGQAATFTEWTPV